MTDTPVVTPLVLTPPITVGELANVPTPGSQIAALWAQDISSRVVQRFNSLAALQAWAAPSGAIAIDQSTGVIYRRGSQWVRLTPWQGRVGGTYQQPPDTNKVTTASVVIPADPGARCFTATIFMVVRMANANGTVDLNVDGQVIAQGYVDNRIGYTPGDGTRLMTLCVTASGDLPPGRAITVLSQIGPDIGFGMECFGEFYRNRLDVTVLPRNV